MSLGFIGTGHLTESIVRGLSQVDVFPAPILLSPRNADRARRLVGEFGAKVSIAPDNQAVLDDSDCVCLAVRPQVAESVVASLRFSTRHTVISFIAMASLAQLRLWTKPAAHVVRAATLPYAAHAVGPSIVHPRNKDAEWLLEHIGTPLVTRDEREFEVLLVVTSVMASYMNLITEITDWATNHGVEQHTAGSFTASMFRALPVLCDDYPNGNFHELVASTQTSGGINEQALKLILDEGGYEPFRHALDQVRERLGIDKP